VGHMGRFGVTYVHWCCGDERHLDRLQVLALRGVRVDGGLGCFMIVGSSGPSVDESATRVPGI
jgi:hypothetical protein